MSDVNKNNNNHANYYGIKSLWLEVSVDTISIEFYNVIGIRMDGWVGCMVYVHHKRWATLVVMTIFITIIIIIFGTINNRIYTLSV